MKKRNIMVLGIIVVVVALVLLGVFVVKPRVGEKEAYVIGSFLSITGAAAPLGTPERDTLLMLEDKINNDGGINGHPLKIVIEDDASEPTNAVKAVKKLIDQDNVLAIVGGSTTGTTMAVLPTIEEAKIPLMCCCAGSAGVTNPVIPWVFRTPQTDRLMMGKILDYLGTLGITKVAMIYDSNAYGTGGRDQLRQLAPGAGVTVVDEESFNTNDTDFSVQLTKAANAGAEAIICWGTNPAPAILTRNRQQLGIDIPLIQSHGVANAKYLELSGDAAEGVVLPAGRLFVAENLSDSDPQKQVLLEYASEFKDLYGRDADTFGGHTWDGLNIIVKALQKSGADPAKLRDAIEETKDFVGIGGTFNYSPTNHDGLGSNAAALLKIENGQFTFLQE